MSGIEELRSALVGNSLFAPTTLMRAIDRLGFVQADPIRAPARAQDLILRHRVKGYKAGDLEKRYPDLDLEEEFTFAYGFLPSRHRSMVHPRRPFKPSAFERRVIESVAEIGRGHPAEIDRMCGSGKVKNAWGGQSKQTKQALEKAHHHGLLRICGREKGIRVYEAAAPIEQEWSTEERFKTLLQVTVFLFGPTSESVLMKEACYYRNLVAARSRRVELLEEMVEEGVVTRHRIDGVDYVWPKNFTKRFRKNDCVKFLAPFDPIVRDRDRFEQLWGWAYRFEAYTPAAKRIRGYYALPMLWKEDVVGWVNAGVEDDHLTVEPGYVRQPKTAAFKRSLEAEVASLATFLGLADDAWSITYG